MWIDDDILAQAHQPLVIGTWVPERAMVVLGRSNKLADEVKVDWCRQNDITLFQRYGGGGTVVLYPGCVVVSVGCWVTRKFYNEHYFALLNQAVIKVIAEHRPGIKLSQAGVSDITLGERKVGGTSMFRSGNYLLYQASVICELDIALINGCLNHPSSEPDYRGGRAHEDFLADLSAWRIRPAELKRHFDESLMTQVIELMASELGEPEQRQMKNLINRWQRGINGEGVLS